MPVSVDDRAGPRFNTICPLSFEIQVAANYGLGRLRRFFRDFPLLKAR